MNGSVMAFIAGVIAVLLAFLGGIRSKSKDQRLKTEKAEKETLKKVSSIQSEVTVRVAENSRTQGESAAEHDEVIRQIEKARKANDMDAISRIAQSLAERALNRGASQK